MKRIFILFPILVFLMLGVIFKTPISAYANGILYKSQCDTPKTFRIGKIDSKYNMTDSQFIDKINLASNIWSEEYGKNLFTYSPEGDIEVNLVYDQRQFLSSQISDLNSKVKIQQNQLDPRIAEYKRKSADFRARATQLNNDIEFWNSKGGAPDDEFERLKSRQENFRNEAAALQQEATSLNQSADEYNQQIGQLQQTVNNFNEQLSYKPEEGEYIYNNGEQTINIYFDNSETQLVHTLAHELGHALEISHNANENSIMYPQSTEATTLSAADKKDLQITCMKKSIISEFETKLKIIFSNIRPIAAKN
ncbi:MAG TPA: matrixin family metalloprotease [Candidatus Limnocylindrales bacterium]|nr:matrixin family metalloprotease [Candidatus Limnocylindrales bacterium]